MTEFIKQSIAINVTFVLPAQNLSQNKAPLGNYTVGESMERFMMDILGHMLKTVSGNKYILVLSDWSSLLNGPELLPCRTKNKIQFPW